MSRLDTQIKTIYSPREREVLLASVSGIISGPSINAFRDFLTDLANRKRTVLLDFAGVTYINSTGLGKLVWFFDRLNETSVGGGLVNVNAESLRLMQLLGLQEVLSVFQTVADALACLDRGITQTSVPEISAAAESGRFRISTAPAPRLPEARVLVGMSPDDPLAKLLVRALTGDRGHVLVTNSRQVIQRAIADGGKFDLAILDANLPLYQQICLDLKVGPQSGLLSIIKIASSGAAQTNLRVCADESIAEPFDIHELFALAQGEYDRTHLESLIIVRDVQLSFSSAQSAVEEGLAMVEELIGASGLEEIEAHKFLQAVSEAIDNARKHGNREDPFKGIRVQYILDREKITFTIEDEGEGFDFRRRLDLAKNFTPLQQTRMIAYDENRAGLGINIMLKCCDSLEYTAPGNQVRLTKYV